MDILKIREDFPILHQQVNKRDLVYFDNAATSQKPKQVIDAIDTYYKTINSNIHRGVHTLSQLATNAYEDTRVKLQQYFNAKHTHEIIFTRGTTESLNLLAYSFTSLLKKGDEIIISALEHHSNIVPWQMLCERTGAVLKVIPMNEKGELLLDRYKELLSDKTKIVSVSHVSNALGTINPVREIIELAHPYNAVTIIDGAQATPHMKIDFQELDCDFYVASAHKMYGPTGIGFLYGKEKWLNKLPPFHGGGEMIKEVTFEKTIYADLPFKFEAGTPNIEAGIAFGAAIDYITEIGIDNIAKYEDELVQYATKRIQEIPDLTIYGTATNKAGVLSFNLNGIHPFDVGSIIDKLGIAVRTGHHCTQPIMQFYKIPGTVRASFAFYNTKEEIDRFIEAVKRAKMMLS
ncbi:MAG TPA: cysteine desulfurase [Flavobacteriia bacterium]|nr:cysteine desulfurase [Flavobacteriia bacterium]